MIHFIVSSFVITECDVSEDNCIGWNILEKGIIQIKLTYATNACTFMV